MWRLDLCFSFYQHPKRVNLFLEFFKINLPSATYIENQKIVWYATKFTRIRAHNCKCVRILGRTCMHIAPIFPCRCLKFCPLIGFASPKFFPWLHPCTVLNTKNNIINDFLRNPHCSSSLKLQNWIFFCKYGKVANRNSYYCCCCLDVYQCYSILHIVNTVNVSKEFQFIIDYPKKCCILRIVQKDCRLIKNKKRLQEKKKF